MDENLRKNKGFFS